GHGRPAGGRYRSVDPQEKKVKRHILRLHNILRSHVVPSAADMLAVAILQLGDIKNPALCLLHIMNSWSTPHFIYRGSMFDV
ncbi:hypothetical protein SK128_006906, partial [Halocaridina rubra]